MLRPWGQWDWPLTLSTLERAGLELLDELPERESFHQVDKLMEGLSNLSPRRLQKLPRAERGTAINLFVRNMATNSYSAPTERIDGNSSRSSKSSTKAKIRNG